MVAGKEVGGDTEPSTGATVQSFQQRLIGVGEPIHTQIKLYSKCLQLLSIVPQVDYDQESDYDEFEKALAENARKVQKETTAPEIHAASGTRMPDEFKLKF